MFKLFKHLLPDARAWRITTAKNLRSFFIGLAANFDTLRVDADRLFEDIDPALTREIDLWESQFGLPNNLADESARRARLAAEWQAIGGQSPRYIQDTLQGAGFPVYLHEAWPGSNPAITRDPRLYLSDGSGVPQYLSSDNDPDMLDGDLVVAMDGARLTPAGYPLVNKDFEQSAPGVWTRTIYPISADPATWAYYLYIGGATFGDFVTIPASRRDEFEDLCLKICPAQLWLGMLINYS